MGLRRVLALIVGAVQGAIGILAIVLVGTLYLDFPFVQIMLDFPEALLPLETLVLIVFSFFSIVSSFYLIHEGLD